MGSEERGKAESASHRASRGLLSQKFPSAVLVHCQNPCVLDIIFDACTGSVISRHHQGHAGGRVVRGRHVNTNQGYMILFYTTPFMSKISFNKAYVSGSSFPTLWGRYAYVKYIILFIQCNGVAIVADRTIPL